MTQILTAAQLADLAEKLVHFRSIIAAVTHIATDTKNSREFGVFLQVTNSSGRSNVKLSEDQYQMLLQSLFAAAAAALANAGVDTAQEVADWQEQMRQLGALDR